MTAGGKRRVWVRRPKGTATTIAVSDGEIVDDLKTYLIHKFHTTLGRLYDSPDLVVKLVAPPPSSNHRRKKHGPDAADGTSGSPHDGHDSSHSSHRKHHGHGHGHSHGHSSRPTSTQPDKTPAQQDRILQPDEVLWTVLDQTYPNGMTMHDALVVEVVEDWQPHQPPLAMPLPPSAASSAYPTSVPETAPGEYFPMQPKAGYMPPVLYGEAYGGRVHPGYPYQQSPAPAPMAVVRPSVQPLQHIADQIERKLTGSPAEMAGSQLQLPTAGAPSPAANAHSPLHGPPVVEAKSE
ncbi:uncharacterized protein V1510DRAFT_449159, partial [Dipodascopsis tothii]|uniref:uncharacterized protein n=1 Tax=Dipodascopsis tothii TaxID=44089 RepID=UPI0034CE8312